MAFNFGAPAQPPAGAPPPAPAAGASGFGAAPAATTGGGFSFAAAPSGASAGAPSAFSFGAPAATAPAPGTPAPAPGGVTFGAPSAAAPAAATPAPATGAFTFAFSAPAAASTTPAPGAFSFSSTTPAAAATAASTTAPVPGAQSNATVPTESIPEFQSVFPNLSILTKVRHILPQLSHDSDEGTLAGQELIHILQCQPASTDKSIIGHILSRPQPLKWVAKNDAFRSKLQNNPTVKLREKEAVVTPEMMKEMWQLADDLRISEMDAMTLYAAASDPDMRKWLESRLDGSFVDAVGSGKDAALASPLKLGNNVPKAARELFFYERGSALTVLLSLIQDRIQASTANTPNALLVATDQLIQDNLVENLISLVRDWTVLSDDLEKERAQRIAATTPAPAFGGMTPMTPSSKSAEGFTTVLLSYAHKQRQLAAEALFYLAYHTQYAAAEVASLVDLIKDVTNGRDNDSGLPILDPFKDVPSAFVNPDPTPTGPWAAPYTAPLPPLKEKDPIQWQHELVRGVWKKGGKPQLLKCVSVLVMSVISALDARHVLMDRNLHGPNEFGVGNALLPPSSGTEPGSTDQLLPIQQRLDPKTESNQDWRRKDIWGLLTSSYALLLLPVESVVTSPGRRASWDSPSSPRRGRIDVKSTWRACLEAPTQMKSFTFARVSLIPSFEKHSVSPDGKCDNYEFYMSVLSEFISQYLDVLCASGNVPISREQWKSDEETELQVQRVQQEQQKQFRAWSGTTATTEEVIPAEVDLMNRPDCMDDVIALAVAVCSTGPEYAINFWSVADEAISAGGNATGRTELVPSRALKTLERLQTKDTSLLSSYLSFLVALALADAPEEDRDCNGAAVVYALLSKEPDLSGDTTRRVSWSSLLSVVRWYARELSASVAGSRGSTDTLRSSSSGTVSDSASTAYYYGTNSSDDVGGFRSSQSQQRASTTTSTTDTKPKELGFSNTVILLSHLRVISSVAANSPKARSAIASMKLSVGDGVGEDHLLTVLFSLAIAPLSPEVRGAVFITISNVLRVSEFREDEKQEVIDTARKGWDLLEESQVLPIALLDQYAPPRGRVGGFVSGIAFPPSSTAQVATGVDGQYGTPWTPPDTRYGIVFEMEHVESRMGFYPSTEGLLHLLSTLVSVGGCPSDLGRFWRARSGCSPYIEYVIHFVLPRAMGTENNDEGLPFRTLGDKSRLVSLALEVVEAVVSRYFVPSSSTGTLMTAPPTATVNAAASTLQTGQKLFGLSSVAESCVVCPTDVDQKDFAHDYRDEAVITVQSSPAIFNAVSGINRANITSLNSTDSRSMVPDPGEGSLPRPKSPGFAVLNEILSSFSGDLFKAVASIISENYASRGINAMYGLPEYEAIMTDALFGSTAPTFFSTKSASSAKLPLVTRHSLLKSPLPAAEQAALLSANGTGSTNGTFWRERSVLLALRVLCAAAVREEKFSRAVNAVPTPLKIVPVLRFHKVGATTAGVIAYDVQVSRLADLLGSTAGTWVPRDARGGLLPTVVDYVGYVSSTWRQDAEISSPAVALVVYVNQVLPKIDCMRSLCGNMADGDTRFSASMARRLKVSSNRAALVPHADMVRVILDVLLHNLRTKTANDIDISDLMLGLPTPETVTSWNPPIAGGTNDSFDVIIDLLSDSDFVRDKHTSSFAAKCYEIMYRLVCTQNINRSLPLAKVLYAAERLRTIDFWRSNLLRFLGKRVGGSSMLQAVSATSSTLAGDENALHCSAWLLKGVSNELRLLMGVSLSSNDRALAPRILELAAPRPSQCRKLLSLLFANPEFLAVHAFNDVPLEKDRQITASSFPPAELIKTASAPLPGPTEVVSGYSIISVDVLLQKMGANGSGELSEAQQSTVAWAKEWNVTVGRDCAVSHFADSLRVVLESSFLFCRPLLLHGFWDENAYQRAPLEGEGIVQLLSLILTRLVRELPQGTMESLYSSAALQLTMVVLVLVQEISALKDSSQLSLAEGDAMRIHHMLIQAIAVSSRGAGFQATKQEERIALLGSSLALLIETLFKGFEGLQPQEEAREPLVVAASALADLSRGAVNGSSRTDWTARGEYRAALSRTARSTLSALFRCHENGASDREGSFVFQVLAPHRNTGMAANSILSSFMALVATLDDDIYSLLSQIALCQFGTEILQDAGLPSSLVQAAQCYSSEEERVQAQLKSQHQKVHISTPSFLSGHLSLLNIMLSTTSLSPERREKLVADAKQVLHQHASTINRMILAFPTDGDATMEFARCMYLMASSSPSGKVKGALSLWQPTGGTSYSMPEDRIWIDLEGGVLDLTYQISLFPFPPRFLPAVPPVLKNSGTHRQQQHVVSLTTSEPHTWWGAVESSLLVMNRMRLPDPPTGLSQLGVWPKHPFESSKDSTVGEGWSDQHYEFAVQSAETLEACLSFLNCRVLLRPCPPIDCIALAKRFCRCADAARAIEGRLRLENTKGSDIAAAMLKMDIMDTGTGGRDNAKATVQVEKEYLVVLGPLLGRCAEKILVLAFSYFRAVARDTVGRNVSQASSQSKKLMTDMSTAMLVALDHTEVESMGIGCIGWQTGNENCRDFAINIAKSFRKELQGEMKSFT